jgi:hypothetical protein
MNAGELFACNSGKAVVFLPTSIENEGHAISWCCEETVLADPSAKKTSDAVQAQHIRCPEALAQQLQIRSAAQKVWVLYM